MARKLTGAVWFAVLSITLVGMTTTRAFTSADADTLLGAHARAFYRMTNGGAFYLKSTAGNKPADFWTAAEQLEVVVLQVVRPMETVKPDAN